MRKSEVPLVMTLLVVLLLTGCSSFGKKMKAFLGGKEPAAPVASTQQAGEKRPVHFSERPEVGFNTSRNYRRMTKGQFENQAMLGAASGSLWVTEGQGAYLFSQNQLRKEGDPLSVRIIGAAREQIDTKAQVIKKLLKKLELEKLSKLAQAQRRQEEKAEKEITKDKKIADKAAAGPERAPAATHAQKLEEKDDDEAQVREVPTRIVEKMTDGNYRIKGSQAFMIGKKEYRVILTGLVRHEDFNEDGIESAKVLDPHYDIVANRRSLLE